MRLRRLALALVVVLSASIAAANCPTIGCNYYASPTGTGNGLSQGSPFKVSDFLALPQATLQGKTLCLTDGTYTGTTGMITPSVGVVGTSSARISIRALTDGGAVIDGQFSRVPFFLQANDYWSFNGFNVKSSNGAVGIVRRSSNVILQRMIFWDANGTVNNDVFGIDAFDDTLPAKPANDNLVEDSAFFGTGRRVWSVNGGSFDTARNICRRCWIRWEGTTLGVGNGPARTTDIGYGFSPAAPTAKDTLMESSLVTWNAYSQPSNYISSNPDGSSQGTSISNYQINQPSSVMGTEGNTGECKGFRVLGSLAYVMAAEWFHANASPPYMVGHRWSNCQTFQHVYTMIPAGYGSSVIGWILGDSTVTTSSNVADHISASGQSSNQFWAGWSPTNSVTSGTVPNPWTNTGNGANLCGQWVNGVNTGAPLWPWPMNQRIKDATGSAGTYGGPCYSCSGMHARVATDVTADMVTLFGTIPAGC